MICTLHTWLGFGLYGWSRGHGMGKGDRTPDNGEGRMNFFRFLHVAWGAPDEILLLTAWSPIALTLPGAGWHDKLLYLIWEGIGCLLVIPLVPSGKRDSKSHRCLYREIHSLTPIPTAVWMEVRGPCGLGGHCVFRRGAGLRAVCGAFVSITQSLGKSKLIPHSHFYSVSMSNGPSLPRQSGTSCGSGRRERGQRRRSSKFRLY